MLSKLRDILALAVEKNVSDIYMTSNQRIFFRVDGEMFPVSDNKPSETEVREFLKLIIEDKQRTILETERAVDFSYTFNGRRFRGNAYFQRRRLAMVLRLLSDKLFTVEEIGLGRAFDELLKLRHGLILVTGKVGSGKTTSIATFLETINKERGAHIITLEDPIEYIYEPNKCFISQREYGADFFDFAEGLRNALREMPDVILVGEIRDRKTLRTAIAAAETGILVLGTLHTKNVKETALRIEGMFDESERESIRSEFAEVFAAIISQELLPKEGGGRIPLVEVMFETPAAKNLIKQGKYAQLESVVLSGGAKGMETKAGALNRLFQEGKISRKTFLSVKEGL
ncbi:MAG: PilT/PilU family type 4a pilus ATPase [Selenomonadaceae bacterium]|nr:PilT/PilU family type 4a pilus ATPase [Selenomonadaceae bacterium]